jgi:hypothetical protein
VGPCGAEEAAEAADAAMALVKTTSPVKTQKKAINGGGAGKKALTGGGAGVEKPAAAKRPAALDGLMAWRGSGALDRSTTHRVGGAHTPSNA